MVGGFLPTQTRPIFSSGLGYGHGYDSGEELEREEAERKDRIMDAT
jgi:hypothetical protein